MYELDNEQPDGVDLPEKAPNAYKNQCTLENFLYKNGFNVPLDWGNKNMTFLVLIESNVNIVGFSAIIPYKKTKNKVHLCTMFVVERLRRKGLGTAMLKHIVVMYPRSKITLSVMFEHADVLRFYMNKGYAEISNINTDSKYFVLSLVNLKLLHDVPLS